MDRINIGREHGLRYADALCAHRVRSDTISLIFHLIRLIPPI
jgi:hypothetical protein